MCSIAKLIFGVLVFSRIASSMQRSKSSLRGTANTHSQPNDICMHVSGAPSFASLLGMPPVGWWRLFAFATTCALLESSRRPISEMGEVGGFGGDSRLKHASSYSRFVGAAAKLLAAYDDMTKTHIKIPQKARECHVSREYLESTDTSLNGHGNPFDYIGEPYK